MVNLIRLGFVWTIMSIMVSSFIAASFFGLKAYGFDFELKEKNSLVELFHKEGAGFHVISEDVTQYIKACCEDKNMAIQLLRKNGFKISSPIKTDPKTLALSQKQTGLRHDSVVFATRGPGVLRFWRLFTSYNITLYIKDDSVLYAYSVIDTTYP